MAVVSPTCFSVGDEQVIIRTAQIEDAAALLDYIRGVAAETEFFILGPDEFPPEEEEVVWIQDHLDQPGKLLLMAEAGGQLIGNLSFENGRYQKMAHRGELGISVCQPWRGRGIGTAMLRTFLNWAESHPTIAKVCLEALVTNERAIRLYKKLGFVEEGIRRKEVKQPSGQYIDALHMALFVKPV